MLARLVGEAEAKVETSVCQRQRPHVEADAALAVPARPAEAAKVDGVSRDEQAGVVAELELQPRRRNTVRGNPDVELERLARQELQPLGPFASHELGRCDRGLAGAPLAQTDAPLRGIRLVGESAPVPCDCLARRPVEGHAAAVEEH